MAEEMQTSMTEANDGFDFMSAIDAIDAASEAAATEEKTEAPADGAEKVPGGVGIRVKYNGEERDLAGDELVAAAQKGLNYDKVQQERDEYRKLGAKDALETEGELAAHYGMTREEYRKFAREHLAKTVHDEELAKVQQESPGISDAVAEELVSVRIANRQKATAERAEAAEAAPWEALAEAYPDIKKAEDVPENVRAAIDAGKDPLLAMREHEIETLKAAIEKMKTDAEAERQNLINSQRSTGKIGTGGESQHDDVWEALLGH